MVARIKRLKKTVSFLPAWYWELVELAFMGKGLIGPRLQDHLKAFLIEPHHNAVIAPVRIQAELNSGAFVDALSYAKINAPQGHVVQHRHIFGHAQGVPVGQNNRRRANPQLFAVRGHMGTHLHWVGRRVHVSVVREVMLCKPRCCETCALSQAALLKDHLKRARPGNSFTWTKICDQIKAHGTTSQWTEPGIVEFCFQLQFG